MSSARSICAPVVGRPVGVDAHQLEVADVAVGAFHAGPQAFPIGPTQAAAPTGDVVGGDGGREAFTGDWAA